MCDIRWDSSISKLTYVRTTYISIHQVIYSCRHHQAKGATVGKAMRAVRAHVRVPWLIQWPLGHWFVVVDKSMGPSFALRYSFQSNISNFNINNILVTVRHIMR